MEVKFIENSKEELIALEIAERANELFPRECPVKDTQMDIEATHMNGCPLKLSALLESDNFNFAHDVFGIQRHLDRETGKLKNFFRPRYAA